MQRRAFPFVILVCIIARTPKCRGLLGVLSAVGVCEPRLGREVCFEGLRDKDVCMFMCKNAAMGGVWQW